MAFIQVVAFCSYVTASRGLKRRRPWCHAKCVCERLSLSLCCRGIWYAMLRFNLRTCLTAIRNFHVAFSDWAGFEEC